MADDLKRVGLVFKADGAVDFKKTLDQVKTAVQENRNEFDLAKAAWDESTTAMDKLRDRQAYLSKQTEAYSDKVSILQRELDQLETAEDRNEKAIRKKQNELTRTQITLSKYEKGLADVTQQLENGSAAADEEMKRLDKTLGDLSAAAKENESAFESLKSAYDENTSAVKKYGDQQDYLRGQVQNYENQIRALESQLGILESAEDRNEQAISQKRTEVNQAKTALNGYKNSLDEVEQKLKSGAAQTEDYTKKLDSFGNKAKAAGDKMSGVSTAAAGMLGAIAATVPATNEYRKIMGSLEVSSEKAGYSAEETAESYRTLYGVLSDDQTAATTTANLQALGLSQKELRKVINGTIGAWATYGDSIPIDSLAEAINETVKTGVVTGTFADMLNWAGTSEDAFNEKLAACSSESERANLVMQEMAEQGLTQAGEKWQENNKNLVEGNKATADFQAATAQMAEAVAPVVTRITELAAGLVSKFAELPPGAQNVILAFLAMVAAASPLITGIGNIALGVKTLSPLLSGLWGIMKANPIGVVATVVGILVAAFVTAYDKFEWFRDGVDSILDGISDAIDWVSEKLDWLKEKLGEGEGTYQYSPISFRDKNRKTRSFLAAPEMPVKWFAGGGILNRPAIFGRNGNELLGAGEAGPEAVLPIDLLRKYIREENRSNNAALVDAVKEAMRDLSITTENNIFVGNRKLETVMTDAVLQRMSSKVRGKKAAKGR